jgi:CelD/BcsL family acetyltransferase involved in cellulose biosynthesis
MSRVGVGHQEPQMGAIRLPLDDPAWIELIRTSADATPFHHPAWARTISDAYGFETFALASRRDDGTLRWGIPCAEIIGPLRRRRWVSLPFTDHVPLLSLAGSIDDPCADEIETLRTTAGISSVELRGGTNLNGYAPLSQSLRHVLELGDDPDTLFRTFHSSQVQRNVKKAQSEGVSVRRSTDADDVLQTFFKLHCLTRRRQGSPVQPRRFFDSLAENLIEPGLGWVSVASHQGVPVAAAVFLSWNDSIIYKFGASDHRCWNLRANHALFWDAIQWGIESGAKTLDFGRTEKNQEGLRAFKLAWAAEESELRYAVLTDNAPAPSRRRLVSVVEPVVKHSPLWFARLLGEVGYRFTA